MVCAFKDLGRNEAEDDSDSEYSESEDGDYENSDFSDEDISEQITKLDQATQRIDFTRFSKRVSCYVHALQLVINDAVKADSTARDTINRIKRITQFFNKAIFWKNKLRKKIGKQLHQPAPTRWSSYYQTVERLSEVSEGQLALTN